MTRVRPELLSPAGDRERLEAAVRYGADAVYLAGKSFGMRSAPQNFGEEELREAVAYCHAGSEGLCHLQHPAPQRGI